MNNTKKMVLRSLLAPLLCGSIHTTKARFMDHFNDMVQAQQKMLEEMELQFNDFAKEFDAILATPNDQKKEENKQKLDMQIIENDTHVTLSFKNLETDPDKITAPVNESNLTISIPMQEETIRLTVSKHPQGEIYLLNVTSKRENHTEKKEEISKKASASYYCYSSSHTQQTLPAAVNLETSEIEYNETEKQLLVKLQKKVTKRIPVTKK